MENNNDNKNNAEKWKNSRNNYVLIGIPGVGKSTVGKLLAERTGMAFIDTDDYTQEMIQQRHGDDLSFFAFMSSFNKLQTEAMQELAYNVKNTIIATGAEMVTYARNYKLIRDAGLVIQIKRDFNVLMQLAEEKPHFVNTKTGESMAALAMKDYIDTKEYDLLADVTVTNDGTPDECADKIMPYIKLPV